MKHKTKLLNTGRELPLFFSESLGKWTSDASSLSLFEMMDGVSDGYFEHDDISRNQATTIMEYFESASEFNRNQIQNMINNGKIDNAHGLILSIKNRG